VICVMVGLGPERHGIALSTAQVRARSGSY